jgi:hypothetical protein
MNECLDTIEPPRIAETAAKTRSTSRDVLTVASGAAALTIVFMLLSPAYGITFDERSRHHHGERVLSFLRGDLSYADFAPDGTGGHLYGGLFDTSAAWLHEQFRGDVWIERHYLGAAFGGLGLLATGLLAVRLTNPGIGLLAVALLALSPRYVAHAMNNPKDLPFAALCMVSLLAFTLLRTAAPFLSWGRAVVVGLALALPLNVRPAALLYIGYFGLLLAVLTVRDRAWAPRQLCAVGARLAVVVLIALAAGTLFWPWAQQNPLVRPVLALGESSHFQWRAEVLFAGRQVAADALPWSYAPVWIILTTPPVVLLGLVCAAGATIAVRGGQQLWRLGLWLAALAPITLVIIQHSTLYDGWRHLLFVYPPLVMLAATGWHDLLVATVKRPILSGVVLAAFIIGFAEPIRFMVQSHPNEGVYFNALVRGPRGAFRRFELDYWGNSLLQASDWSARVANRAGVRLRVSGWPYALVREDVLRFPSLSPSEPGAEAHHLEVVLLRDSPTGLRKTMARHDILHVVRTGDGAPLAVVVRGPRFEEVETVIAPTLD